MHIKLNLGNPENNARSPSLSLLPFTCHRASNRQRSITLFNLKKGDFSCVVHRRPGEQRVTSVGTASNSTFDCYAHLDSSETFYEACE